MRGMGAPGYLGVIVAVAGVVGSLIIIIGAWITRLRRSYRCRCGHLRNAHTHYRRGSDCGLCGCPRFRPVLNRSAQLSHRATLQYVQRATGQRVHTT
jgi:hypothetical protein